MRKIIIVLCLLTSVSVFSQGLDPKNYSEIKLNGFALATGSIDLEFERTLNSNSSIGLSFFSKFNDTGAAFSYDYDSGLSVFYRRYFGKKYASGLFLEGFGMYHNTKRFSSYRYSIPKIDSDLLIGLGLGYKWVLKNGIILQANYGIGRNLFDSANELSGKAGISLGYRF